MDAKSEEVQGQEASTSVTDLKQKWNQIQRENEEKQSANARKSKSAADAKVPEASKAQVVDEPREEELAMKVEVLREKFIPKREEPNQVRRAGQSGYEALKPDEVAKALVKRFGLFMNTTINDKTVIFSTDSKETMTVLNAADYQLIGAGALSFTKLRPSGRASNCTVRGLCSLTITYEGVAYTNQTVIVADISGKSVMGMDLLRRIADKMAGENWKVK